MKNKKNWLFYFLMGAGLLIQLISSRSFAEEVIDKKPKKRTALEHVLDMPAGGMDVYRAAENIPSNDGGSKAEVDKPKRKVSGRKVKSLSKQIDEGIPEAVDKAFGVDPSTGKIAE